jgi:enoyl-CoA hydratase/carnithine racemase
MVAARRFGGDDAQEAGIVDSTQPESLVLSHAVELAAAQAGKDGGTLGTIKKRMYEPVLDALLDRERNRLVVPSA